jgi:hypothetical protein
MIALLPATRFLGAQFPFFILFGMIGTHTSAGAIAGFG